MSSLSRPAIARCCVAAISLALLATACSSSSSTSSGTGVSSAAASPVSTSTGASATGASAFGLHEVPAVNALVPASARGTTFKDGIYNDYPPEMYLTGGQMAGIQVDLATAVSEVIGVKFDIVPVGSFDSLIPGLQGGRYDLSFADFGVTAAREKVVDMVTEFNLGTTFAVDKGSAKTIKTGSDLCGLRVAADAGSYFLAQVKTLSTACTKAGKPAITIEAYPNDSDSILAVNNGRADAYAGSSDAVAYAANQSGAHIVNQPFVYAPIPQAVALPKSSPLTRAVQAALRELVTDGTYAKILAKWGITAAAIPASAMLIDQPAA